MMVWPKMFPERPPADRRRSIGKAVFWLGLLGSGSLLLLSTRDAAADNYPGILVKNWPAQASVAEMPAPVSVIEAAQMIDKAEATTKTPSGAVDDGLPTLAVDQTISGKAGQATALHLSVNADGVLPNHSVIAIHGLPEGTILSGGHADGVDGWLLTPEDLLGSLSITPSADAGGTSVVVILLLTPEGRVARELHAKLVVARAAGSDDNNASSATPTTPQEIQVLLSHGRDLERVGYFAGARLFFQRAAAAGSAEGAHALGETYDPAIFEKLGVHGLTPDPDLAHTWYDRARALEAKSVTN